MIIRTKYIKHSCFFVELEAYVLLFDYYQGNLSDLPKDKPIYAFASHFHQDHFSFLLFEQLQSFTNVTYILSKDIKRKYNKNCFIKHGVGETIYDSICFISSNQKLQIGDLLIETLKSTDSGVAYLIDVEGQTIYHAGDLNWWTWQGETVKEYENMTALFQYEISKLEGKHIDLAFLTLDPRQEDRFYLGFDYIMKHVDITYAYPMHCWNDFSVIDKLKSMDCSISYRDRIGGY